MRIAFYAPLKPPGHAVPSGDRQMARLLVAALAGEGHRVEIASTLRSFVLQPDPESQAAVEQQARAETARIAQAWRAQPGLPDVWFTYHAYYKAPDFLGPRMSAEFGLPYATAEASSAPKRRHGPWARWHEANEAAIRAGAIHFCFTDVDRSGLERVIDGAAPLVRLPPFIDAAPFGASRPANGPSARVEVVTVAMMRPGAKSRSYQFLARALAEVRAASPWRLTVIGDGPDRDEVQAMFAPVPADRIVWRGELGVAEIATTLGSADLFAWPGFDEAYGICYLEAAAAGLPVAAMRSGGVRSVVRDAETGILVPEGDLEAYAAALTALIEDRGLRRRLGAAGRRFVLEERTLGRAGAILSHGLEAVVHRTSPGQEPM